MHETSPASQASSTGSDCPCDHSSCGGKCTFSIAYQEGSSLSGKVIQDKMCFGTPENCATSERESVAVEWREVEVEVEVEVKGE